MSYGEEGYGNRREEKSLGCCTGMLRYFLLLVNGCFILASLFGMVFGLLMDDGKESNSYLRFCEPCRQFQLFIIIVCAFLFFFSGLGFCALWKRNGCLLVTYGFFLVIFFLVSLVITAVIFMIHDGRFDGRLERAWQKEAAENTDDSLCKFQYDLKCSGWDVRCPAGNATYGWANYTIAEKINCPDCTGTVYQEQIDDHSITTESCHAVLKEDIDEYIGILLGIGLTLMALTVVSICITCKIRRKYEDYDEMDEGLERF